MIKLTVQGIEKVQRQLKAIPGAATKGAARGMKIWGEEVMDESHEECPFDTHQMQRSGVVNDPEITGPYCNMEMGYNTVYAWRQHEDLTYHHPHGKAKFLEDPFMRNYDRLPNVMLKEVDKAIKEGLRL